MKSLLHLLVFVSSVVALTFGGCANQPIAAPPDVPLALRPPADQAIYLGVLASGVQMATYYFYRANP